MLKVGRILGWVLMILGAIYPVVLLTNILLRIPTGEVGHFVSLSFSWKTLIISLVIFFIGGTLDYECKRRITARKGDRQNQKVKDDSVR